MTLDALLGTRNLPSDYQKKYLENNNLDSQKVIEYFNSERNVIRNGRESPCHGTVFSFCGQNSLNRNVLSNSNSTDNNETSLKTPVPRRPYMKV